MDNKNLIVVERGNAYTVLHNEKNTLTPWIVAWHFDPDSFTWDQGHYFEDVKTAKDLFAEEEKHNGNCKYCKKKDCPHRDAFRRLPREMGGLGLCENLWENFSSEEF